MRYNLTRHLLLKKLSEKYIATRDTKRDGADIIGLRLEEIDEILGNRKKDRDLIVSELGNCKEIHAFNIQGKGFFITPSEGLSAFSEEKYLKKNNDIILRWLKNFVQIFIPLVSLLIAVLALWLRINTTNETNRKEMERLELKMNGIEEKVNKIEKQNNQTKD